MPLWLIILLSPVLLVVAMTLNCALFLFCVWTIKVVFTSPWLILHWHRSGHPLVPTAYRDWRADKARQKAWVDAGRPTAPHVLEMQRRRDEWDG